MTRVLHLMRHDVGQHWRLLLAWTVLIVAHPAVSLLSRGDGREATPGLGPTVGLLVIGVRLLMGAVLTLGIVQQDAPLDDRTFWRTRPIAPRTMGLAKLALVALVMLGVPLVVVGVVAWLAKVPLSYWPTMASHILLLDGTMVGLILLGGVLTRHLSSGLVAVITTVSVALVGFGYASRPGVVTYAHDTSWMRQVDPVYALPTLLMICVLALWSMALLLWSGTPGRLRALIVGVIAATLLLTAWYFPGARLHRRLIPSDAPRLRLRLAASGVHATRLPTTPERIALLTTATVEGRERDALQALWLATGTIDVGEGPRNARTPRDPNVGNRPGEEPRALLAVISPEEFAAMQGRRVQIRARYTADVRSEQKLATAPLAPGAVLVTPLGSLRVTSVSPASGAIAAADLTVLRRLPERGRGLDLFLRDGVTGPRIGPLFLWHARTPLSYLLQLPTLARPFEWDAIAAPGRQSAAPARRGPRCTRDVRARPRHLPAGRRRADVRVAIGHPVRTRVRRHMQGIAHLIGHDLRTHRLEIGTWLLLLCAHVPFGYAVATAAMPLAPEVATPALLLVRLVLGAITIASILQADAPTDDRSFWRTRPIPRGTMAMAKTALIAGVFLGAPLAIVLLEAMWLRLPLSQVPTISADVFMQDGALIGVMVLVASLTKRVASMVLALIGTGGGLFLLLALAGLVLRSAPVRRVFEAAPHKAEDVLPALGVLLALTTWTMSLYAWRRSTDRRALSLIGAAGVAAGAVALAVPSVHAHRGAETIAGGRAHVTNATLVARVAADGGPVTVLAPLELDGVSLQANGTISVRGGSLQAQGRRLPVSRGIAGYTRLRRELWVTNLSPQDFQEVAGRPAQLTGTVYVDVKESGSLGRLVLRRGEGLTVDGLRLAVVEGVGSAGASTGRLAVTWTRQDLANFGWQQTELFFRSTLKADRVRVTVAPTYATRAVDGALLPTLSMPFGFRYVTLEGPYPPLAVPRAGAEPWLEVDGVVRRTRGVWQLDSAVTVPTAPATGQSRLSEQLQRALPPR